MARTARNWTYNAATLATLSGWSLKRIYQDVTRSDLQLENLESAVVWLAANGKPELRAAIAREILPVVLGTTRPTGSQDAAGLHNIATSYDVMLQIFKRDSHAREVRRVKISKTKGGSIKLRAEA